MHGHGGRARGSASGHWGKEFRVLATDAVGVEALRIAELGIDIDDETLVGGVRALLAHEVDGEVAGELNEAVIAGFCDD